VLKGFDSELSDLADADQLANNWITLEAAIEATLDVKKIDKTNHEA